jgi:hypothetical protein
MDLEGLVGKSSSSQDMCGVLSCRDEEEVADAKKNIARSPKVDLDFLLEGSLVVLETLCVEALPTELVDENEFLRGKSLDCCVSESESSSCFHFLASSRLALVSEEMCDLEFASWRFPPHTAQASGEVTKLFLEMQSKHIQSRLCCFDTPGVSLAVLDPWV